MIVRHRQQIGLARGQPVLCRRALALGTMPVAAANGKFPLAALWARFVMGSWRAVAMPAFLIDRRFLGIVCRSALHNHCVFPPLCNWPPTASHKEGPRCWRLIFRRQRCLRPCETGQADRSLTV